MIQAIGEKVTADLLLKNQLILRWTPFTLRRELVDNHSIRMKRKRGKWHWIRYD